MRLGLRVLGRAGEVLPTVGAFYGERWEYD